MSFRCGICKRPRTQKPHKVVTQVRELVFPNGNTRQETAKEENLCDSCALAVRFKGPTVVNRGSPKQVSTPPRTPEPPQGRGTHRNTRYELR